MSLQKMKLALALHLAALVSRFLPQWSKQAIYRSPFVSTFIRRLLNRVAPAGLTEVTVAAGLLQGMRLQLNLKSEKYFWLGTYEPMLQRAVEDFVRPGMVVYDVGAHIGYVALVFARAVGTTGQVFAFEPLPTNIERLETNISLNELGNVVHLVRAAASDGDGNATFLVHASPGMGKLSGSWGRDASYMAQIEVPTVRLDNFAYRDSNSSPNLVKIDVEGGGTKVIPGMERILAEARPILFVELHGPEEEQAVWSALQGHGYTVRRMTAGYPEVKNITDLAWKEYIVALPGSARSVGIGGQGRV